jgi:hypothetical protein
VERARAAEDLAPETVVAKVVGRVAVKAVKVAVERVAVEAVAMEGAVEVRVWVRVEGWVEAKDKVAAGRGKGEEAMAGAVTGGMGRLASQCCCIPQTRSRARWCSTYPTTNGRGSSISV